MTKTQVVRHFGSPSAAYRAVGVSRQAFSKWPEILPARWAMTYHVLTLGALHADPSTYGMRFH